MSSKEKEKFEKKLLTILNTSSNAKAWSDLLPMTKDILNHLSKNSNDIEFSQISTIKHILAKRLAQCLNPEFPNGVHEVVLDIYTIIFNNIISKSEMKLMDNLGLYASGLFPFFTHASLQNKQKFLEEIVKMNLLIINPDELTLCFPGLLASLIPGLDDNDESTTKLIFESFEDLLLKFQNINEQTFFGTYWTLLLRNKHLRCSGIKFLVQKIIKYSDLRKKPIEEQNLLIKHFYPNINTTVVNALCEIIKDEDIPTVRNGMDFILTRFPLSKENDFINDDAKVNLLINILHLLIKNESTIVRRLNNWILGINNDIDRDNYKCEDMNYKMNLIIEAFKNMFNPEKAYSTEELLNNLTILERFFENQTKFSKYILSNISYLILKCVVNYWQTELNGSENVDKNEIVSKVEEFFSKNNNIELLWISLANKLKSISEIQLIDKKNNDNNKESINYRATNDTTIQNSETENSYNNLLNEINENIIQLKFCLLFIDIKTNIGKINYYFPIITHLLNIITKIKYSERENLKDIRHIILITLVFIKNLQDQKKSDVDINNQIYNTDQQNDSFDENDESKLVSRPSIFEEISNSDFILYEIQKGEKKGKYSICEEASLSNILKIVKNNTEIIQSLVDSFVNFQKYYINILTEYLKITKDMQITKYEEIIFIQCSELVLRLQEYCQQEELPIWIYYLEKIIFCTNINIKISLEAANFILDLVTSTFKSEIFKKIKYNFYYSPVNNIENEVLLLITQKTGMHNNCYELLMGKLYLFLLEQKNQRTVINLLVKIINLNIDNFEYMVLNTLSFTNSNSLVEGIKLFSEFWKLTNEAFPDLNFFNTGECIFKMLDYLDNKNPLLRHLSKTWLNQVSQKFNKILDPIIDIFLEQINLLFEEDQIYFEKEYNTEVILGAFSKLKNIILNSSISSFLFEEKVNCNKINLSKIGNPTLATLNYLCLLISIALRLTQARCKDSLNSEFKIESYGVNAASCEFLEFLVNIISDEELLINVANEINRPLIKLLDKAVENNDEVMQVQLLAVIKKLDFDTSIKSENNSDKKNIILSLLKDEILEKVLIKGMTSDYYFVRENFINFTKNCLPIFISIIDKKQEFENIFGIGINFISALTKYLANKIYIEKVGRKDNEKFSHFDNDNNNIIFKNYLEEYKEYKSYDENDILLILKGIKDILLYFLSIDYDKESPKEKKEFIKSSFGPISIFKKHKTKSYSYSSNHSCLQNGINNYGISHNSNDFNGNWSEFKKNLMSSQRNFKNYIFNIFDDNLTNGINSNKEEDFSLFSKNVYRNKVYNLLNGLILTWVNQSDKYEVYDYCLNLNGILAPTEINSWNNMSNIEIKNAKEMINKNPIKKIVIEIAFNLFCSNPIQFIEKILEIWCFGQRGLKENISSVNACIDKQFQLSIIELLISMNVPLNIIFYCINQILINKYNSTDPNYQRYKKSSKSKVPMTPYEYSLYEAKIFHFIYSYILLNPIHNKSEITEIWREMNNIFNTTINNSKIIYTFCWVYEVMQISLDKFQIIYIDNNEILKSIIDTFNIITTKLMDVSFENKFESQYFQKEKLVLPTLPHIYTNIIKEMFDKDNLYKKNTLGKKQKKEPEYEENKLIPLNTIICSNSFSINNELHNNCNGEEKMKNITLTFEEKEKIKGTLNDFYEENCANLGKSSEYNSDIDNHLSDIYIGSSLLNIIYRQMAMITLKENYFKIYKLIYGEKLSEIKKQLTEILKGIISLMKTKDSLLKECASDFLVSLMEDCPKKVTKCGKDLIMNFFNDPIFFKTGSINLHNWSKIISHYVEYYPEILTDLLNNLDGKNILLKTNDIDKIRILRRISFIIYSCKKDTFSKEFDLIQSKAKDLLSGYSSNNNLLEGEIFLIMRILFLRFSHEGVMKMIRDLWPIIFIELIKNIENEDRNKDIHLLAETFKFIELLSLANIEEFSLYEWIFIMDTFNMNYLDIRKKDSLINRLLRKENKSFKPLAINILSKGKLEITDQLLEGKHQGKSELYIKTKKNNFEELYKGVKNFFYSIIDMNSYKVPVNFEQIEQIIEKDFINQSIIEE